MSMLAITAGDDALAAFGTFKKGKSGKAWIIYAIDGGSIKVESEVSKADAGEDYLDAFITAVKGDDKARARYATLDWNHKILFVLWNPEGGKPADKMKYATACEGFFQALEGCHAKLQATDDGELSKEIIEEKTKSTV